MHPVRRTYWPLLGWRLALIVALLCSTLMAQPPRALAQQPRPRMGYGLGVAEPDAMTVFDMGFDWMAMYEPPNERKLVNVLYRMPMSRYTVRDLESEYGYEMYQYLYDLRIFITSYAERIEAYEIGNEVNLYLDGWEAAPNAADYVKLLCQVARTIKEVDPTAVIISAGLAPTGRVVGNWNGHTGHNYRVQDEREYLREFLAANARS